MNLSEKERELVELYGQGLAYKEIARETGRPVNTVKDVLTKLRQRFNCRSTAALAVLVEKESPKKVSVKTNKGR